MAASIALIVNDTYESTLIEHGPIPIVTLFKIFNLPIPPLPDEIKHMRKFRDTRTHRDKQVDPIEIRHQAHLYTMWQTFKRHVTGIIPVTPPTPHLLHLDVELPPPLPPPVLSTPPLSTPHSIKVDKVDRGVKVDKVETVKEKNKKPKYVNKRKTDDKKSENKQESPGSINNDILRTHVVKHLNKSHGRYLKEYADIILGLEHIFDHHPRKLLITSIISIINTLSDEKQCQLTSDKRRFSILIPTHIKTDDLIKIDSTKVQDIWNSLKSELNTAITFTKCTSVIYDCYHHSDGDRQHFAVSASVKLIKAGYI